MYNKVDSKIKSQYQIKLRYRSLLEALQTELSTGEIGQKEFDIRKEGLDNRLRVKLECSEGKINVEERTKILSQITSKINKRVQQEVYAGIPATYVKKYKKKGLTLDKIAEKRANNGRIYQTPYAVGSPEYRKYLRTIKKQEALDILLNYNLNKILEDPYGWSFLKKEGGIIQKIDIARNKLATKSFRPSGTSRGNNYIASLGVDFFDLTEVELSHATELDNMEIVETYVKFFAIEVFKLFKGCNVSNIEGFDWYYLLPPKAQITTEAAAVEFIGLKNVAIVKQWHGKMLRTLGGFTDEEIVRD